jgi:hypothetical protein
MVKNKLGISRQRQQAISASLHWTNQMYKRLYEMPLVISAILLTLATYITPSKSAKPLPPEVQSVINEAIKSCDEKVQFEKGFLTRRDINSDSIDDFILDYRHFICGTSASLYCGSAGCLTQVFASLSDGKFAKVLDDNVQAIKFQRVRGRPAMLLELNGSACGKVGAEVCRVTLYWNGETFSPAH